MHDRMRIGELRGKGKRLARQGTAPALAKKKPSREFLSSLKGRCIAICGYCIVIGNRRFICRNTV
jgi:hypothetical protein